MEKLLGGKSDKANTFHHNWGNFTKGAVLPPGIPMDIDYRRLDPQERAKLAKEKKCFLCKKPGHFARECRSKSRNFRKRINKMEEEEEGEETDKVQQVRNDVTTNG